MFDGSELRDYRKCVDALLERHRIAVLDVEKETVELNGIRSDLEAVSESLSIVQKLAQSVQQRVHDRISGIVTMCLASVFDDPYEFVIKFDRKRGRTEARIVFSRDGNEYDDPLNEVGGGVVDVAAFALKVACILMNRPKLRRFMVLDEPFGKVRGQENKARTKTMLERLVNELGFQIILTSDIKEYQLGSVIHIGDDN